MYPKFLIFTQFNLFSLITRLTSSPNPPHIILSSIVTTNLVLEADLITPNLSNGFKNLAFITSADIPISFSLLNNSIALLTWFPIATIVTSVPFVSKSLFPFSIHLWVINFCAASPPRGYLITTGDFNFTAKSIIIYNSIKSFGAIIVIFGINLKNDKSKIPWCVSPSCPTIPALSTHIITGKFCIQISCITWSYAL